MTAQVSRPVAKAPVSMLIRFRRDRAERSVTVEKLIANPKQIRGFAAVYGVSAAW
jgi:hypothetical protein